MIYQYAKRNVEKPMNEQKTANRQELTDERDYAAANA